MMFKDRLYQKIRALILWLTMSFLALISVETAGSFRSYRPDMLHKSFLPDKDVRKLTVISFNSGLLKFGPFPLVPCVDSRLQAQVDSIFNQDVLNLKRKDRRSSPEPFVLLLQEVWTETAFLTYQSYAHKYGLTMVPSSSDEVTGNGLVIISNLRLSGYHMDFFAEDDPGADRGILQTHFRLSGQSISVANIHTSYDENLGANLSQLEQIRRYMEEYSDQALRIIAGDFNIGPELKKNMPLTASSRYFQEKLIGSAQIRQKWRRLAMNEATWNGANLLAQQPAPLVNIMNWFVDMGDWSGPEILDHLFVSRQFRLKAEPLLALNSRVKIDGCSYADEQGLTNLSDHYGIRAELEF
ncbi:MAG: endonuclease/exonuclease/phosphatase family protein [Deltaproteobacteria bacterium]|nr:endonuclease/exonuclease/phosphatase family protein [Deltaproteobacteria bacterium]